MKLAFTIFRYYPFGGLQRDCVRLAKYCHSQGHNVTIFTMDWQGEKPEGISIQLIPKKGFSNSRRAKNFSHTLQPLLKHFDKVIGFDRMQGLDFYFAGDLCFAETMQQKHSKIYQLTPRYKRFKALEQQVFSETSHTKIFVLTENVKRSYQKIYKIADHRFIRVPPGIAKQRFTFNEIQNNKLKLKLELKLQGRWTLLQVGSDFKRKGVDRSLHALAALPKEILDQTHYYSIGKGHADNYMQLAKKLGIDQQVHFLGTLKDVGCYMQAADVLLHPAYFETAGMVLVEALSFGLPVVVTENCGYAFYINDAQAGAIISSPYSQSEFNQTLLQVLDAELLKKYSSNAISYAQTQELYSMDEVCLNEILS